MTNSSQSNVISVFLFNFFFKLHIYLKSYLKGCHKRMIYFLFTSNQCKFSKSWLRHSHPGNSDHPSLWWGSPGDQLSCRDVRTTQPLSPLTTDWGLSDPEAQSSHWRLTWNSSLGFNWWYTHRRPSWVCNDLQVSGIITTTPSYVFVMEK